VPNGELAQHISKTGGGTLLGTTEQKTRKKVTAKRKKQLCQWRNWGKKGGQNKMTGQ